MKKFIKTTLLLSMVIFLGACSTTANFNPSKPEMSVPDNNDGTRRTFNQFKSNWSY